MSEISLLQRIEDARFSAFRWRVSLSLAQKFALAVGFAVITGICALLKFYVSWSVVPLTLQTLPVLLAGVLLGQWWGGLSMVLYIIGGCAGIPWFAGPLQGTAALFGPTGGYLMGFVFSSLFLGYMTDRFAVCRTLPVMSLLMITANAVLIYIPGAAVLSLYYALVGKYESFSQVMHNGVYLFVAGDALKIAIAALIASAVTPRKNFID